MVVVHEREQETLLRKFVESFGVDESVLQQQVLLSSFLYYGNIEEAYRKHPEICSSVANYRKLIKKWGLVPHPPNTPVMSISSIVEPFRMLALHPNLSIEELKRYFLIDEALNAPELISDSSLYRIQNNLGKGVIRHRATGFIVTLEDDPTKVLIGEDLSLTYRGKEGKRIHPFAAPACLSGKNEDRYCSLLRVLQQEVMPRYALQGDIAIGSKLSGEILNNIEHPLITLLLLDVAVDIYHLSLPCNYKDFLGGGRFANPRFVPIDKIVDQNEEGNSFYRPGIVETAGIYKQICEGILNPKETISVQSALNEMVLRRKDM